MSEKSAKGLLQAALKEGGAKVAAKKPVTFHCDNPACVVRMTIGTHTFVFQGTGGTLLSPGKHTIFYAVKPKGQKFTITAKGGTMVPIVNSTSGTRDITV